MNKEVIEQAALHNAIGRFDDDDEILDVSVQSFMDGVKWERNEVWHDTSEYPERENEYLLVEYRYYGESVNRYEAMETEDFGRFLDRTYLYVIRWAYVSDFLPEGKEDDK